MRIIDEGHSNKIRIAGVLIAFGLAAYVIIALLQIMFGEVSEQIEAGRSDTILRVNDQVDVCIANGGTATVVTHWYADKPKPKAFEVRCEQ